MGSRLSSLSRTHRVSARWLAGLLIGVAALSAVNSSRASRTPADKGSSTNPTPPAANVRANYGQLPLSFEANRGQADRRVKFLARGQGYGLFLTGNEAVMELSKSTEAGTDATLRMQLVGAKQRPRVGGADELPGKMNYFIGNDPAQWRTDVPTYARVKYDAVYPGIDLVYYGKQQQLEYDFIVQPGADPRRIRLRFAGAQGLRIDERGDLLIKTKAGVVRQHKPIVFQQVNGDRREVAGSYKLRRNEVTFEIGAYDKAQSLVIDPAVTYATFITERGDLGLHDIGVDAAGHAYLVGGATPTRFAATPGAIQPIHDNRQNPFNPPTFGLVIKLNSTGTQILYTALINGSQSVREKVSCNDRYDEDEGGSCYRYILAAGFSSVAVDAGGNAYLSGYTKSVNFPTTPGAYRSNYNPLFPDGRARSNPVVLKLSPAGNRLLYATMYEAEIADLAVTPQGQVWLGGGTSEYYSITTTPDAWQPAIRGSYPGEAFVARLNETGSQILYATYLGSGSSDGVYSVAADPEGNAYVAGITGNGYGNGDTVGAPFPTTPGSFRPTMSRDGIFIAKFAADGLLNYATFLGSYSDSGYGPEIAADADGNAYITGTTRGADFPTTPGAYQTSGGGSTPDYVNEDVFVSKLNPSGAALVYSTYLGGAEVERGLGIQVDAQGNAIVAGRTNSTSFPLLPSGQPAFTNGGFVTKFNAAGSGLIYSYVFDQGSCDAVAVDQSGNAYVTGTAGSSFVTTANAYKSSIIAPIGWIAAKIDEHATPPPPPTRFIIAGRTLTSGSSAAPPFQNVTVRLTGTTNRTVVSGQDGRYQFDNVPVNGNYIVTPQPPVGYRSSPESLSFASLNSNQVANFVIRSTATPTPTPVPTPTPPLNSIHVSAANYQGERLGRESIVTAFGVDLATAIQFSASNPPPQNLAGTTVKVKDSQNVERMAPLFFVSPTQLSYQIPPGTPNGNVFITITNGNGVVSGAVKQVDYIAPGLFTIDASGRGLAAAVVLRVKANGQQSYESVARYDQTQNRMVAVPIDLGPVGEQVYLLCFGTGFRFGDLEGASARIGGVDATVTFTGAQGGFAGLDQANLLLPRTLIGRGEVDVIFYGDGRPANTVKVWIK